MKEKYYLYFQGGSTRRGDYTAYLHEFDTLEEVLAKRRELVEEFGEPRLGLTITIIRGEEVDV